MSETKKRRTPMKVPSKQALKDEIERLTQENKALDSTVDALWAWKASLHQSVMDALQANRYAFVSAEMLSQVAHKLGNIIRGEDK